jgi:hypothetical protein
MKRTTAMISPPPLPDQISTSVFLFLSIAIANYMYPDLQIIVQYCCFSKGIERKERSGECYFLYANNNYVIISLTPSETTSKQAVESRRGHAELADLKLRAAARYGEVV